MAKKRRKKNTTIEKRAISFDAGVADWGTYWQDISQNFNSAGQLVTEQTALQISAVYAAIRIVSQGLAQMPVHFFKETNRGKERERNHPLSYLMNTEPNNSMTAMTLWETWIGHTLSWGNGYVYIVRDDVGNVTGFMPMRPDNVRIVEFGSGIAYFWQSNGKIENTKIVAPENILHINTRGMDGVNGVSIIKYAKVSHSIMLACEAYSAKFWKSGARPSGAIKTPHALKAKGWENLKKGWIEPHRQENGVPILEDGAEWQTIGLSPQHSQWIESRRFGVEEVSRWYGVPTTLLANSDTTFNNSEALASGFLSWSLNPWLRRIEQEMNRKLLKDTEFFIELCPEALLRTDIETRYRAHNLAISGGWRTPNEVRQIENFKLEKGLDFYTVPMSQFIIDPDGNLLYTTGKSAETDAKAPPEPPKEAEAEAEAEEEDNNDEEFNSAKQEMLQTTLKRCLKIENNAVGKKVKKFSTNNEKALFLEWVEGYYDEYRDRLNTELTTVFNVFKIPDQGKIVESIVAASKFQIRSVSEKDNCWENLTSMLKVWQNEKTNQIISGINNG